MFNFLNNIIGFAEIEIQSENPEEFLNLVCKNKVSVWNLRYKNKKITARIKPKDFKLLRPFCKTTKSKIRIIKKRGIVFKTEKLKPRTGLFIGAILFICIIKVFSFYVQGVEVKSNKTVDQQKVLSVLNENGVRRWAPLKSIDTYYTAQKLILALPDIDFASVNIEGCIVTVNLHINIDPKTDSSPSNIIAKCDGVITKIDVASGETVVKPGDSVLKGDLLVSGKSRDADILIVEKSRGKILAKTTHIFKKTGYLRAKEYVARKTVKKRVLDAFGLKIPLYIGSVKKPYVSKTESKILGVADKKLPIRIATKTFCIKEKKTVNTSEKALAERLKRDILRKIKKQNYENYEIGKTKIGKNKNALTVYITVNATEDITKEQKIGL